MKPAIAVSISLGPSRAFAACLAIAHGTAAAAPWLAGVPVVPALAWSAGALVWGGFQIRRHALLGPADAAVHLACRTDGSVLVTTRAGGRESGRVGEAKILGPWVVFVRLAGEGGGRSLVVWRDACGADGLRRLRVWVRWCPPGGATPAATAGEAFP